MLKAIIFDFDGVLGDTFEMGYRICNKHKSIKRNDFREHLMGNPLLEPVISFPDNFNEQVRKKFTEKHLFSVNSIISELNSKYKIFIISSSDEAGIKYYLSLGQLDKYFTKIFGQESQYSKVKKFKMLFTEFKLKPEECLFVTDTVGDIKEARISNVKTIAVTWGVHSAKELLKEKPFAIVKNKIELLNAIDQIRNSKN
jgi:phosphoglycolate phosphatase